MALGLYFSPPLSLRSAHHGRLWERWRDRYPRTADQVPLPPLAFETFPQPFPTLQVQFASNFPGVRVWYLSENGDQVLQVQPDRLVLNWRRTGDDERYPHYEMLRPVFRSAAQDFLAFAAEEDLGFPAIAQAEVTYVNPIPIAALGNEGDVARLVAPWSGVCSDAFLPSPERVNLAVQYRIPDPATGEPLGRLYIQGAPAVHRDIGTPEAQEVFMLRLFARGRPLGDGLEGAFGFLDVGHDWVVRGFTSVTTPQMHKVWGREK